VGDSGVLEDALELLTYECDALPHLRESPAAVVLPSSAADVQAIVRLCAREGVPFVARGHGTGLSGGALPVAGGLVIALSRLNRVLHVDIANQRVLEGPFARPRETRLGLLDEQVDALVEVLDQVRPQVVVSYGPDGGYGHPDHVRAHYVTMAAAPRIPEVARVFWAVRPASAVADGIAALRATPGLPFPLPVVDGAVDGLPGVPDAEVTTSLDISAHRGAMLEAMRAHATQIRVWTQGPHAAYALSDGVARPVSDTEYFTLAHGAATGSHDDLFGGLAQ